MSMSEKVFYSTSEDGAFFMAKKITSTSLTEFSPQSPEADAQAFSFKNLFGMSKAKEPLALEECGQVENKTPVPCSDHLDSYPCSRLDTRKKEQNHNYEIICSPNAGPDESGTEQNKGMNNILKRVMNFMDRKNDLQNYRDSDFKQYWMPDSNCKECYECGDKFTTFRRRHHCRVCGQIFCRRCCNQGIPGNLIGYTGDLRVCTYCFKTVLSCVQSLDTSSDISTDLQQVFHANMQQKLFCSKSQPEKTSMLQQNVSLPVRRKSSVMGFREEDIAKANKLTSRASLADFCSNDEYSGNPSESESKLQDISFLRDVYAQLTHSASGVSYEIHEHKLNSYVMCMTGSDVVDWLIHHNRTISRSFAVKIGQALLDAKFLECTSSQGQQFVDGDALYKPKEFSVPLIESQTSEIQESMEPLWVKEIQPIDSCTSEDCSTDETRQFLVSPEDPAPPEPRRRISSSTSIFYLNLDLKESRVTVSKPYRNDTEQKSSLTSSDNQLCHRTGKENSSENPANVEAKLYNEGMQETFTESVLKAFNATQPGTSSESSTLPQGWHGTHLREDNDEKAAFERLNSAYHKLEINLLRQLLSTEGLSLSWCDVILPIVHRVIDTVRPDVKNDADDMDIRQYVQFKKIPGGSKSECMIVSGVVFSKTVAHRKMAQNILQPTLLLLSSSLAYHRVENKFSSIDPILMQEFEYLKNTVAKITVYKPDILLVEKTVSRLAQEMLLDHGITVVLNIKPTVMERIARCTQATIVSTVDAHLARPQLGTCHNFRVKTYSLPAAKTKTLVFFDGCPANLGCTILLRGGSAGELKKVKQIVQFMIYVAFNWQLERSFLMDEYALPPTPVPQQPLDMDSDNCKKTDESSLLPNSDSEDVFKDTTVCSDSMIDLNTSINASMIENAECGRTAKNRLKSEEHNKKLEAKCVDDYSDPLHSYLRSENDVVSSDSNNLRVASFPQSNTFRKLLDDTILCCSINVKESLPFLETEPGKNCELRKFFPNEIYWSEQFSKDEDTSLMPITQMEYDDENASSEIITSGNAEILPSHKFVSYKFTEEWDKSNYTRSMLADFRARGGTIKYLCPHERVAKEKRVLSEAAKDPANKVPEDQANTGLCWEKKVDALNPFNHQSIAVLFCSYSCTSNNAPNYCVNPWVVKMDFYGSNDITLGGFLERYCFRPSYVCPSSTCDTPMTEHVRKFVHSSGCVHILLHELSTSVQAAENIILMWSWCQICKQASPVVTMSQDTWSFSFAKYLELRFYADSYGRRGTNQMCTHSLHHDHYQYFAHKQLVAIFEYTPITVWEVGLPSLMINVQDEATSVSSVVDQIKIIAVTGYGLYSNIHEKLFALQEECSGTSFEDAVSNMIALQKHETTLFREKIEQVQLRLTSPTLENMQLNVSQNVQNNDNKDICNFMWKISDQVTALKYHITEAVQAWNTRIQDFVARKKEEKLSTKTPQTPPKAVEQSGTNNANGDLPSDYQALDTELPDASKKEDSDLNKTAEGKINESLEEQTSITVSNSSKEVKTLNKQVVEPLQMKKHKLERLSWIDRSLSWESIPDNFQSVAHALTLKMVKALSEPTNLAHAAEIRQIAEKQQEVDRCSSSSSSSSSSYTYGVSPGIYAGLMVPEPPCSESYIVCHKEHGDHSVLSVCKGHERSKSEGAEMLEQLLRTSQEKNSEEGRKSDKKERTVRTLLSQLLSNNAVAPIQSPFSPSEHMFFQNTDKIPIIVYDDEPSSIIAYALSSIEYEQQLQELKLNISAAVNVVQRDSQTSSPIFKRRQVSKTASDALSVSENLLIGNEDSATDFMDMTICNSQEADKGGNKTGNKMSNFHIEIQFNDSNAKFYCRVYFAEQFRKLRCLVFGSGEERYIRSLSRCIRWVARGGKSGSTFCKTTDDRFILKQMPKLELQSFLDLAPSYFQYINKACLEQKPTLLAKIVGVYRIGYKNTATNSAVKMDLLVMENLFYGCNISQKYDLKGSVRNRLVNTSGVQEDDIVLLDENLLKITCDCPLYLRPHSKTVLSSAIANDTQFLANQSVMDYSLLVGLYEDKKQLIVGIIDYIRTFTWDKKVEMLVKSSGILGGHGKMPTVVSPELYRERFCEAMDGYFLWVPDRWTGLGKGVDC